MSFMYIYYYYYYIIIIIIIIIIINVQYVDHAVRSLVFISHKTLVCHCLIYMTADKIKKIIIENDVLLSH